MPKNWKTYTLGEVVDLKQGLAINKGTDHLLCADGENSIPLFKIRDLLNDTVEHYVKADEVPKQCVAIETDLIYTRTGQVGYVFRGKNGCIHNNCFKVIPDNRLHREFLFHFLANPAIRKYANEIASGSVQKDLNHGAFKSIDISLPDSIVEQRAIASILSALDDKIENNRAMNKTLEDMAMALYNHWFVDFGPFKDGEFVDSELGMIPKGWEVKPIGEIIETIGGGTPKTKINEFWENGDIDWYSPTDLTKSNSLYSLGSAKKITELGLQKSSAKIFPKNSLLMSSRATIGAITINRKEASTNQGFITMLPNKALSLYQLHGWTLANMDLIISKSNGSTFKEISKTNFRNLLIVVGIKTESYIEKSKSIYGQIENNILENQTLTKLRDTLLPKLISGEVRLKEFKEILANVV